MHRSNLIVINSADRINQFDSSNRFTVKVYPSVQNARKISLEYVQIPNSTYNITSNNNKLSFDDTSTYTIDITPGSYTATTLATQIAAQMNAVGARTYTVTYDPTTYHYTISATGLFSLFYNFFGSSSIFPTLGFRFTTNSLPATSFTSNAAIQLMNLPNLYIKIDKAPFTVQSTGAASNFASFVVNSVVPQNGTFISWTRNTQFEQSVEVAVNFDTLFIELSDANNNLADINSSEWSMGLRVYFD